MGHPVPYKPWIGWRPCFKRKYLRLVLPNCRQITQRRKAGDTQQIEWNVQKSTYQTRATNDGKSKDAYTSQVEKFAKDNNVILRWFNDKETLIKNINTNSDGNPRQGDERITSYDHFGHGYAGKMSVDFQSGTADNNNITMDDVKSISKDAFAPNSKSNLYPCNSASQIQGKSMRDVWEAQTGSQTNGVVGRMDYAPNPRNPAPTAAGAHWTPAEPTKPKND